MPSGKVSPAHPRHGLFSLGPLTVPWGYSPLFSPAHLLPLPVFLLFTTPSLSLILSLCLSFTVSVSPCLFYASLSSVSISISQLLIHSLDLLALEP